MIKEGVFNNVDALILHPSDASMPDDISFAQVNLKFDFTGKASHPLFLGKEKCLKWSNSTI